MRKLYLVDNSVIQRIHRSMPLASALAALVNTGDLASCLPQVLEEGYSARNAEDHRTILDSHNRAKVFLPPDAQIAELAFDLQTRLFKVGRGRAVGVSDLQIAATALRYSTKTQLVTIVHYDSDFDFLVEVEPNLHAQWILPPGSID